MAPRKKLTDPFAKAKATTSTSVPPPVHEAPIEVSSPPPVHEAPIEVSSPPPVVEPTPPIVVEVDEVSSDEAPMEVCEEEEKGEEKKVDTRFQDTLASLTTTLEGLDIGKGKRRSIVALLKKLDIAHVKVVEKASKQKKKSTGNHRFNDVLVSEPLASFLAVSTETKFARTAITKLYHQVIKTKGATKNDDGTYTMPQEVVAVIGPAVHPKSKKEPTSAKCYHLYNVATYLKPFLTSVKEEATTTE